MARPKKEKEVIFCPICGKEMPGGDSIKLNLEQLSVEQDIIFLLLQEWKCAQSARPVLLHT